MRTLLALVIVFALCSVGQAQSIFTPGYSGVLGPYQPSPFGGYVYFNPSVRNPYYGYVAPSYRSRGRYRGDWYHQYRVEQSLDGIEWELRRGNDFRTVR